MKNVVSKLSKKFRVPYALTVYGREEVEAVKDVLKDPTRIVSGPLVRKFEQKIARLFGKKFGIMVNSGSSANLIATELMNLPRGSEVVTPALTFGTTLAPLIQRALTPAFVDVQEGVYQIDIDQIESVISKKTRALFVPSLLGNLPDFVRLRSIANKYKLWFVEDSCDTLGARYAGKPTGYYSDISTTSFYASHIITAAGTGGLIALNDPALANRALVMSNWGRESTRFGSYEKSEEIHRRFKGVLGGEPYDAKFIFSEVGYNFQVTEISGAFGLEQLKRYSQFAKQRKKNFKTLMNFFKQYESLFILPVQDKLANTAWLAFPLTIRAEAPFTRLEITKHLEEHNIQTRPVFTGNVLKQPAFIDITARTLKNGYPVTDNIMRNGFLIGCHQGMTDKHIACLFKVFDGFLKKVNT